MGGAKFASENVLGGLVAVFVGGCGLLPVPAEDALVAVVSTAAMNPQKTCEELRESFGVYHLTPVETPDEAGLPYEAHMLPKEDGAALRVWDLPADADRGVVVFSMGSDGNMACYLLTAKLLVDDGWSLVMYEYEGFGGSTGVASVGSLPSDLETVLEWTLERHGVDQATLMGMSLGTIPTVAIAVARPEVVNAVILDSPVALGQEFQRRLWPLGSWWEHLVGQLDPDLVTEDIIDQMEQPLLVFVHGRDTTTPAWTGELLFERAAGPKRLVRFPELGHGRGVFFETETYADELAAFLSDAWEGEPR